MDNLNELQSRTRAINADISQLQINYERDETAALLNQLRRSLERLNELIDDLEEIRNTVEAPKIDRRVIREVIAPELDLYRARRGRM